MNAQNNSTLSNLPFVEELSDLELEAVSGGVEDIVLTAVAPITDNLKKIANGSFNENGIGNGNEVNL